MDSSEEQPECLTLTLEEKCKHKAWKVRLDGYTQFIKLFNEVETDDTIFQSFQFVMSNVLNDSNVFSQEKGLEAVLLFLQKYSKSSKEIINIVPIIVNKYLGVNKIKTKEVAVEILMVCIELEQNVFVTEELTKGTTQKNPKIISGCINTLTLALSLFGPKVIDIKILINLIPNICEDRDKSVRDEAKTMMVEIYKWVGDPLRSKLSCLKPCQMTELETEFQNITTLKQTPTRFLKSKNNTKLSTEVCIKKDVMITSSETFNLLESINILDKLPADFYETVDSKKWQDRRQALECLDKILDYPKFEKGDYKELVRCLTRIISTDSNIVVLTTAVKCITKLARGLKSNFHTYSLQLLPIFLEKFKEKKLNVVQTIRDATDAVFMSLSLESIHQDVAISLESKNPCVQSETVMFVTRCFSKTNPASVNKKIIKLYTSMLIKTLNESDPSVREASAEALGTLLKLVGENTLMPFLADVDSLKLIKIKEYQDKAVVMPGDVMSTSMTRSFSKGRGIQKSPSSKSICSKDTSDETEVKSESAMETEVDLSVKISEQQINELNDKNWSVRNDALTAITAILQNATSVKPTLGKLPATLVQRISDSNPKIAVMTLECCGLLASALGSQSKVHFRTFCRGFLSALSDHRPNVRTSALSAINVWCTHSGSKELFEGELIPEALKSGSPFLRTELYHFLTQVLKDLKDTGVNKDDLIATIPYVYANLEDRNVEVRKAAASVLPAIMLHVGYHTMVRQTDTLKPSSVSFVISALDKHRIEVPEKIKKSNIRARMDKSPRDPSPRVDSRPVRRPSSRSRSTTRDESPSTPLLSVNNAKQQRMADEQKMKVLRWSFLSPRPEFVDLLHDQMVTAKFSKNLIFNLLHNDFKYHLKAIELLSEELSKLESLKSNLDLILKWSTLRFFDTNPSVLLKVLDYLHRAFGLLIDNQYNLSEYEANIFIPFLILKYGDQKDVVRERVRTIIRQLVVLNSPTKIFPMLVEGTKSKNVRQRSECLEEIAYFIDIYSATLTPLTSLKDIAIHVSDRDTSVRNAALNCILKVWCLDGDKIYKIINQHLSPVEINLVEDKIRRLGKSKQGTIKIKKPERPKSNTIEERIQVRELESPQAESAAEINRLHELIDIDISFLDTPISIPEYLTSKIKKPETPLGDARAENLTHLTMELSSPNIQLAYQAGTKLRVLMENPVGTKVEFYIDHIVDSLNTQLHYLNSYSLDVYGLVLPQTYRVLLRLIDDIFVKRTELAQLISSKNLQTLMAELVYTSVEDTTSRFVDGGYSRIILIYISRIIENADFTNVTCACIKQVVIVVINPSSKLKTIDTTTKCLLKTIHLLKKNLTSLSVKINLDRILFECHIFFEAFPQYTWKDRPTYFPLKTIKALLLTLVQWKGKDILSHMTLIESSSTTELCLYLKKLLKSQSQQNSSNHRLTKAMSEHLSEVFMKIASENTAKEGLIQLYDFKKHNPDIDLIPYLSPTSKYFQEYVTNGLKEVEKEVSSRNMVCDLPPTVSILPESDKNNPSLEECNLAQYYLDKLKIYHKQVGLPPPECPDFVQK